MPIFIKTILKSRQNNFLIDYIGEITILYNVYKKTTTVISTNICKKTTGI